MNATTDMKLISAPIPLDALVVSKTDVQARRRAKFTEASIQELADTVKSVGRLIHSILVRRLPSGKFEIIAGERRYLACKKLGFAAVDATLAEMTDEQVIKAQLVENLQREDIDPIDEAYGFAEWMKLEKITADQLAVLIGKSRTHVYGRLKLRDLGKVEMKLVSEGKIDPTVAQAVARIPVAALREECAKALAMDGHRTSYRQAIDYIHREYMLELKEAPFPLDEKSLGGKVDCKSCPSRSGNARDLFPDIKSADICTDPACFKAKREAFFSRLAAAEQKKGSIVYAGKEGEAIVTEYHSGMCSINHSNRGFVLASDQEHIGGKYRTWKSALGKHEPIPAIFVQTKSGKLVQIYKRDQAVKALREAGVITGSERHESGGSGGKSSTQKAREAAARLETEYRLQVFQAIRQADIKFDHAQLRMVALVQWSSLYHEYQKSLDKIYGWDNGGTGNRFSPANWISRMNEGELFRLMLDMALVREIKVNPYHSDKEPENLIVVAKSLKIPVEKIKAALVDAKKIKDAAAKSRQQKKKAAAKKKVPVKDNPAKAAKAKPVTTKPTKAKPVTAKSATPARSEPQPVKAPAAWPFPISQTKAAP